MEPEGDLVIASAPADEDAWAFASGRILNDAGRMAGRRAPQVQHNIRAASATAELPARPVLQ